MTIEERVTLLEAKCAELELRLAALEAQLKSLTTPAPLGLYVSEPIHSQDKMR